MMRCLSLLLVMVPESLQLEFPSQSGFAGPVFLKSLVVGFFGLLSNTETLHWMLGETESLTAQFDISQHVFLSFSAILIL